jgi:P27 family predicted phage terminase small subunit
MSMPGPAPKPTALKKLAGNPGKRPLNENEPKPQAVHLHAPAHLTEVARAEWRRITPELYRLGLLTVIDRSFLAGYCESWADWIEAEKHLKDEGKVLETDKGYKYINPWVTEKNKALEKMHKFGVEFGFSPSSRTRIKLESNDKGLTLAEMLFTGVEDE